MSTHSFLERAHSLPLCLALLLAACGGAPEPKAAEAPAGTAAQGASQAGAAPAGTAKANAAPASGQGGTPIGRVLGVAVSDKDDHFTRVTVSFENPTAQSCKIPSYVLSWSGGSKQIPLENFTLAPGQKQTRAVRIHKEDGDLTKLTGPDVAHVELKAQCGAP